MVLSKSISRACACVKQKVRKVLKYAKYLFLSDVRIRNFSGNMCLFECARDKDRRGNCAESSVCMFFCSCHHAVIHSECCFYKS